MFFLVFPEVELSIRLFCAVCWAPIQLILLLKSLQISNWDSSFNKIVGQVKVYSLKLYRDKQVQYKQNVCMYPSLLQYVLQSYVTQPVAYKGILHVFVLCLFTRLSLFNKKHHL
jgi:hypothetical protein